MVEIIEPVKKHLKTLVLLKSRSVCTKKGRGSSYLPTALPREGCSLDLHSRTSYLAEFHPNQEMAHPGLHFTHTRAHNLKSPDFFLSLLLVLQLTFFHTHSSLRSLQLLSYSLFSRWTPAGFSLEQDLVTASTYFVVWVQPALAWSKVKLVAKNL